MCDEAAGLGPDVSGTRRLSMDAPRCLSPAERGPAQTRSHAHPKCEPWVSRQESPLHRTSSGGYRAQPPPKAFEVRGTAAGHHPHVFGQVSDATVGQQRPADPKGGQRLDWAQGYAAAAAVVVLFPIDGGERFRCERRPTQCSGAFQKAVGAEVVEGGHQGDHVYPGLVPGHSGRAREPPPGQTTRPCVDEGDGEELPGVPPPADRQVHDAPEGRERRNGRFGGNQSKVTTKCRDAPQTAAFGAMG
mmetsp:Transcript_89629/g.149038  ORF Transcript_89629/g.149038 Transcript_89629/m.149038 type:complete len:246 (+) Transcript_89629:1550-2287(+)